MRKSFISATVLVLVIVAGFLFVAPVFADSTATKIVYIKNHAFDPSIIKIKVGTTVTWINNDDVSHTVMSATDAAEDFSSHWLSKGEKFSHKFTTVGINNYICSIHPPMRGTVIVSK
jgi:plastocyanin